MGPSKSSHLQHHWDSNFCQNSSMIFISNRTIGLTIGLFAWCKDSYISKKIIIWVVGSPGFTPWTLNPKKPSMMLWHFRVKHIVSLPSHAFQDDNSLLTKYVSIKGCNLLRKWSSTLLHTKPCFAHWNGKNNYVHFLSPNFLQRKN
jgi:hypothetical protein